MKLKRILLCMIVAGILSSLTAYAAQGNNNLVRQGEMEEKYGDYIYGSCVVDDTLYVFGERVLLSYRDGDNGPSVLEYALPDAGENTASHMRMIFANGGRLFGLIEVLDAEDNYNLARAEIAEIRIESGHAVFGVPKAIDIDALSISYGADDLQLAQSNDAVGMDGRLYLLVWDDFAGSKKVYCMDVDSGEGRFLDVEDACGIAAWEDSGLLIETFRYSDERCQFLGYDPSDESITPICPPIQAQEELCGIAYSAETKRLFYLSGGYVMAVSDFDFDGASPVAELSTSYYNGIGGKLLPGDLYAYSTFDLVAVRATDPDRLPARRLVVQGSSNSNASMNAYYDFTEAHGDVAVIQGGDGEYPMDDSPLIEAMLRQDSSVDIYKLNVADANYAAVFARGYMAELDSGALLSAVSKMYPAIQRAVTRDGALVAIPVSVYGWLPGFNMKGFEKIGIPREDVPDNWPDLLELLSELPGMLPEDRSVRVADSYLTQKEMRYELINAILRCWLWRLQADGQELRYDAPELKALLEGVMALDLEALGVPEELDESYSPDYVEDESILIQMGAGCTIGNFDSMDDVEPVALAVRRGEAAQLPADLTVAFVNPYSENIELAQEYLEALLANLDIQTVYNLSDAYNEAERSRSYESDLAKWQESWESAQAELERADPVDRPALEDRIASLEREFRNLDEYGWIVSPNALAWYRAHAENLIVEDHSRYVDGMYEMLMQLVDGQMNVDAFLKEIDRKVHMREKEGV